jgi:flagellar protein FliO/FliZ
MTAGTENLADRPPAAPAAIRAGLRKAGGISPRRPAALGLCLFSPWLAAAAEAVPKGPPPLDMARGLLGLSIVLLALFALVWLLRRFGNFSRLAPGQFRVLAAVSLGARERAVLLQAGKKQLVLGVAAGRVETLCVLEEHEHIPVEAPASGTAPPSAFAERLGELLGRRP